MKLLLTNGNLILSDSILADGWILLDGEKIHSLGTGVPPAADRILDAHGQYISPGFIDIHTHGGGGFDFTDCTVEAITGAAKAHMKYGTTAIVPTLTSCPAEEMFSFFDCYRQAKHSMLNGPELLGVHLEGPYFSAAQCGAQAPEYLKTPVPEQYLPLLDKAGRDLIRVSAAPELEGALELGKELEKRGIMASIGHSDASYAQVLDAMANGYTHVTHLYSGMSSLHRKNAYRELGVVESAYLEDGLTVEIIADGCHLPPELLRLIMKCKPKESICLVTDSMRGACLGSYTGPTIMGSLKNGYEVLIENEVAFLKDHTAFAGSVCTSNRCIRTMYQAAGVSLPDAVSMMSLNPARFLGIQDRKGSLEAGKDADICIFNENIDVDCVIAKGKIMEKE